MQNAKSSQSKRGAVPIFFFHILYVLPVRHLSIHLLLCLRAGVSSLAAVLVLVQCSCGVRLVSLPALQSHPWLELGGESLRSHVPETLLCAPQDWCSLTSLRRRTYSRGGGVSGERAAGLKVVNQAQENGKVTVMGSGSGNGRWSSS